MDAFRNEGLEDADALEKSLADMSLRNNMRQVLEESDFASDETRMQQIAEVFEPNYLSAKVRKARHHRSKRILSGSRSAEAPGQDHREGREVVSDARWGFQPLVFSVIVSQWTTMLDLIERHLRARGIRLTSITGKVLTKDRYVWTN